MNINLLHSCLLFGGLFVFNTSIATRYSKAAEHTLYNDKLKKDLYKDAVICIIFQIISGIAMLVSLYLLLKN